MNGDVSTRGPLIVIGASARAAAQSAIRAGYQPWCIDLFADRDLQQFAPVKRCPSSDWPHGVVDLMHDAPEAPVLLTGAMENHYEVVGVIEKMRTLVGMSADDMAKIRGPELNSVLVEMVIRDKQTEESLTSFGPDIPWVVINFPKSQRGDFTAEQWGHLTSRAMLVKPRFSAGGRSIRHWQVGEAISENEYLEAFIEEGTPISGVFRIEQNKIVFAAFTEQLVGDSGFGAREFQYVGNIGPIFFPRADQALIAFVEKLCERSRQFKVKGVIGVDAIYTDAERWTKLCSPATYVLEVNPRFPAGAEVWERTTGRSVLSDEGIMTGQDTFDRLTGKAIVYAKQDCIVPDLLSSFYEYEIADVPSEGERIRRGEPICTVFAQAETRDACYAGLRDQAERVYTRLQSK